MIPGFHDKDGSLEFAAGSVVGLRSWTMTPSHFCSHQLCSHQLNRGKDPVPTGAPLLRGHYGWVWRPGVNTAFCPKEDHAAPSLDCTCGFYAYWSIAPAGDVTAVIEGWGHVIYGERGFRCQHARLKGVAFTSAASEAWRKARSREAGGLPEFYGVPVYPSIRAMMLAHPTTLDHLPEPERTEAMYGGRTLMERALRWLQRRTQ